MSSRSIFSKNSRKPSTFPWLRCKSRNVSNSFAPSGRCAFISAMYSSIARVRSSQPSFAWTSFFILPRCSLVSSAISFYTALYSYYTAQAPFLNSCPGFPPIILAMFGIWLPGTIVAACGGVCPLIPWIVGPLGVKGLVGGKPGGCGAPGGAPAGAAPVFGAPGAPGVGGAPPGVPGVPGAGGCGGCGPFFRKSIQ